MRTVTRIAAVPSALVLTAGLLAGCNDPNEESETPTESVSPEDTMEEDTMDDDTMEEDTMEDDSMDDDTMDDDSMDDDG